MADEMKKRMAERDACDGCKTCAYFLHEFWNCQGEDATCPDYIANFIPASMADNVGRRMTDRFGYGEIGLDITPRHPCEGCRDYEAPDGCKSNGGCGKPKSNGDAIRGMNDYDLADWIAKILDHCENKMPDELCRQSCPLYKCCNDQPSDNIEDWLKAPVKVDE